MKMASPSSGIYSSGEVNLTSSPSIYFGPKGKTSDTPLLPSKHKVQTILSTGSDRILYYCDHIKHDGLGLLQPCLRQRPASRHCFIESLHLKPLDGCSVVSNSRMVMHGHDDHHCCKGQKADVRNPLQKRSLKTRRNAGLSDLYSRC